MQQIFRWLFKVTHEQAGVNNGKDGKSKDIILYKQGRVYRRRSKRVKENDHHERHKYFMPFAFLCRKDVAKACFYNTLSLRRLGSFNRRKHCHWIHSMNKMKKEKEIINARGLSSSNNHKADNCEASHTGNKVLPVSDHATLSSSSTNTNNNNEQCGTVTENNKKDKNNKLVKWDKTRTMSRMKELLRWAGAAKPEKGGKFIGRKVLHFRNRSTLKSVPDDDQLSTESPKISFRWEVESCSTTSSVYSGISMASSSRNVNNNIDCNMLSSVSSTPIHRDVNHHCTPRIGNWITTDSEFVVLEL